MNAADVIARLCLLQAEVSRHIDPESHHAADCFCREGGLWPRGRSPLKGDYDGTEENGYRNEGKSLAWIERVVHERIETERTRQAALDAEKPQGATL